VVLGKEQQKLVLLLYLQLIPILSLLILRLILQPTLSEKIGIWELELIRFLFGIKVELFYQHPKDMELKQFGISTYLAWLLLIPTVSNSWFTMVIRTKVVVM
jgi:hypothetical protein